MNFAEHIVDMHKQDDKEKWSGCKCLTKGAVPG